MLAFAVGFVLLGITSIAFGFHPNPPGDAEAVKFYEQQIRPLLAVHCLECHGAEKQQAGLRLDSRVSLLKGGDSGPAILADKPEDSLLLRVINYQDDIKMPPRRKLSDDEILLLTRWIHNGAVFPENGDAAVRGLGFAATPDGLKEARATHWAYQPIRLTQTRNGQVSDWSSNSIDEFVLAGLKTAGLTPGPAADRRTLLRRVTFDLIGLPPTLEDVADFEGDSSPDAWERAIDRLLASPHYGERWGRHWLDLARYADTKGYVFQEERKYPYAYTYRDYVIDAFNRDLPFDQFVLEQLAADQLGGERSTLAAMGFLTVGRRFVNKQPEIIDDRIDVVSRGLLGLTVSCARCHDHKYDAIPTADYYSLYGVFASSTEPAELPLLREPEETEAYRVYEAELRRRETAVEEFLSASEREFEDELRSKTAIYLLAAVQSDPPAKDLDVKPLIVRRWRDYLAAMSNEPHPVFDPWHALVRLPSESFAEDAQKVLTTLNDAAGSPAMLNREVMLALLAAPLSTKTDVASVYGQLLAGVQEEWVKLRETGATALPDPHREELRQVLYASNSPLVSKEGEFRRLLGRDKRNQAAELKRAIEAHQANSPGTPPRAMVLIDASKPIQPHIFIRGNPGRPGQQVPRQFLQVLQSEPKPFQQGSGRLELARAIVNPNNPLTARVIVNRLWQQHFGKGIVRTSSDFGVRGEPPTHPELLDWMAGRLVEQGWSLKWLHRTLLSTATYQQVSDDRPESQEVDPDNRWLWKMNRRRLEFEPWRDALFAVANQLDDRMTGQPVDLFATPFVARRAVYGFIDRQDLPGTLRVFDFASPDVSTAQRPETTVPQQLLYTMNSPLVIERARGLAQHAHATEGDNQTSAVQYLYHQVFARSATNDELSAAEQFLQAASTADNAVADSEQLSPLEQLAQALLLTNEFVFVD